MANIVILKDMTSMLLLAGLMCGVVGFVHAQTGAAGASGGAGGQGGVVGGVTAGSGNQFGDKSYGVPSGMTDGGTINQPGSASPGQNKPGKSGSSSIPGSNPVGQSKGMRTNPSTAPRTPGTGGY